MASGECPFFLMHGRDFILPVDGFLKLQVRYIGQDDKMILIKRFQIAWNMDAKYLANHRKATVYDPATESQNINTGNLVHVRV